ncbi:MAG: LytTR family DNA-binding domain-containing protein [Pseudomonadota bacterium]
MSISTVIVDDEPLARARLQRFIQSMDGVVMLATGENGQDALALTLEHKPDVLLLDIEMPVMNGLDAAAAILKEVAKPPAIIFCTAYENYALEAFATNAVGYLLKPISFEKLNEQLLKAQRLTRLQLNAVQAQGEHQEVINVAQPGFLAKLPIAEILYFRAEDKSVVAGLLDKEVIVSYPLKQLEQKLTEGFVRVHRSALVNSRYFDKLVKTDEGLDVLSLQQTSTEFVVSRRHLGKVRTYFKQTS